MKNYLSNDKDDCLKIIRFVSDVVSLEWRECRGFKRIIMIRCRIRTLILPWNCKSQWRETFVQELINERFVTNTRCSVHDILWYLSTPVWATRRGIFHTCNPDEQHERLEHALNALSPFVTLVVLPFSFKAPIQKSF